MQRQQTALLTFMRHGEKADDGSLTETGHVQARRIGQRTQTLTGNIMLFHSGVSRVRDTVRAMAANLNLSEHDEQAFELGENIVDYIAPNLHYLIDPQIKGKFYEHWDDIALTEANIQRRMRDWLQYGRQSPEPGICWSPRQMAQHIAIMVGIEVRFANMTDLSQRVNFVNGSHEPVLMSFLHYFLGDYEPKNTAIVERLGYLDYAEGFEIAVYHTSPHDFEVEFRFRDIMRPVDLAKMREFGYSN